jgi:hypothetical protein
MMTDEIQQITDREETYAPEEPFAESPGSDVRVAWWRRLLPGRAARRARLEGRIQVLDDMIALRPDVAVNFAVRGECYLEFDQPELALLDFERALAIAQPQIERDDWGLVAQAVTDRALRGAEIARRRLPAAAEGEAKHLQTETEFWETGPE